VSQDRNFDDLADRFRRNIYGSMKGTIRLNVIERDFRAHIPEYFIDSKDRQVIDIAAGEARFSSILARSGCGLVVNDISRKMLDYAEEEVDKNLSGVLQQPFDRIHFVHAPLQGLRDILAERALPKKYDLIICHALIEWLSEPQKLAGYLRELIAPDGYLSLTFYNLNGLAFKNLLRTNFKKFDIDNFKPHKGSLTPAHPQNPHDVQTLFEQHGFQIICRSGIRVFHDYIFDPVLRDRDVDGLLARELEYSQREPFWQMARYIHFLCRFTSNF